MKEKENLDKDKFNNPAKSSPQVGGKGKRKTCTRNWDSQK